jgi:outer membrane receptor protein involved in Fe transport
VQDTWQARPNLSFNYGLRWDVETTPHDKNYATQAYNPLTGALFSPGHQYYDVDFATVGPRFGVAYSLTPRTVLRAGSGLFFQKAVSRLKCNVFEVVVPVFHEVEVG